MPLKLKLKTVAAPVPAADPSFDTDTPIDVVELMERLGDGQAVFEAKLAQIKTLEVETKAYKADLAKLAELVSKHADNQERGADTEFVEHSAGFMLQVGKQGSTRRVINLELAMKRLGKATFFQKASIGLGVLDQYLSPAEREDVVVTERGTRTIKLVKRVAKAA